MSMHWDVTEAIIQDNTSVWVRFRDGREGIVQFMPTAFRGVFAGLREPGAFKQVRIEDGVLTWPGDLDLAPDAMHAAICDNGKWILD